MMSERGSMSLTRSPHASSFGGNVEAQGQSNLDLSRLSFRSKTRTRASDTLCKNPTAQELPNYAQYATMARYKL